MRAGAFHCFTLHVVCTGKAGVSCCLVLLLVRLCLIVGVACACFVSWFSCLTCVSDLWVLITVPSHSIYSTTTIVMMSAAQDQKKWLEQNYGSWDDIPGCIACSRSRAFSCESHRETCWLQCVP